MVKNIFTVAIRNIWRQKGFSFINIIGLAFGIAACILIFLFVEFETSFDTYHSRTNEIYRVVIKEELPNSTRYSSSTPQPLPGTLQMEFPGYDITGLYNEASNTFKIKDKVFQIDNFLYVDSLFFKVFDVKWIKGSPVSLQNVENSIALTEKTAKAWFGNEDPIGKVVTNESDENLEVIGIVENCPSNSSIPYNAITSYSLIRSQMYGMDIKRWGSRFGGFECYVALHPGMETNMMEEKIGAIFTKNYPRNENDIQPQFLLQPLKDIHYEPELIESPNTYATTKMHIVIFAFIGLLILILACINFVNLATAQAIRKAKEVGVRKVLGAYRSQVFVLFLAETFIMTIISVFLALILTELLLPYFNNLIGGASNLSIYHSQNFPVFLIAIVLLILLMAGFYPAVVLSRFNPVKVLKTHISAPTSKISLRNVLVVLQFSISIILVICTIVINIQVNFMKEKDLGFKTDNILFYRIPNTQKNVLEKIAHELNKIPGVKNYTFAFSTPSSGNNLTSNYSINGIKDNNRPNANMKMVDESYAETFGLQLVAGRWLKEQKEDDTTFEFVVNEKLVKDAGYSPMDAINMKFSIGGVDGKIVGVAKNFHLYDLRREIGTLAFVHISNYLSTVQIEAEPGNKQALIEKMNALWSELFPENLTHYEFLEDTLMQSYEKDTRTLKTIRMFSVLGIIIALLGLFGLVSYMITQQRRVIGIRKVLGASVSGIIGWVSSSYLKLVIIANIIAWPVSYLILQRWLEQFAYRINIPWAVFLLTAIASLLVAHGTILIQALKASRTNPVEAIKYE